MLVRYHTGTWGNLGSMTTLSLFPGPLQDSVQQAVHLMGQLGLEAGKSPVYFGQLLGMADHLTFTLGSHGYPAFKYVPYGLVQEVRAGRGGAGRGGAGQGWAGQYLPFAGCLQHCSLCYPLRPGPLSPPTISGLSLYSQAPSFSPYLCGFCYNAFVLGTGSTVPAPPGPGECFHHDGREGRRSSVGGRAAAEGQSPMAVAG